MSFRALGDRVFIRPDRAKDKTDSGLLIIPDRAKTPPTTGIVVYAGPGMLTKTGERWPMPVRPGDRVIYLDNQYVKVTIAGEELLSMRDDTILAVVENDR
jgi:chaperonin GroES